MADEGAATCVVSGAAKAVVGGKLIVADGVAVPGRVVEVVAAPVALPPVCCDGVASAPVGLIGAASPVERPRARGMTVSTNRLSVR